MQGFFVRTENSGAYSMAKTKVIWLNKHRVLRLSLTNDKQELLIHYLILTCPMHTYHDNTKAINTKKCIETKKK